MDEWTHLVSTIEKLCNTPKNYLLYKYSTQRQIWEVLFLSMLLSGAGLVSQCQTSWTWVEMQALTEAQQAFVVFFKACWYKINPSALVMILWFVKWVYREFGSISHIQIKPARGLGGSKLFPKEMMLWFFLCLKSETFKRVTWMGAHVHHDCVRSKCLGELRTMVEGKISVNSKLHFGVFLT